MKNKYAKSQVIPYFNDWLDLMELAWAQLGDEGFKELEDKIIKEILARRGKKA